MARPRDSCGGKSFRDANLADWRPHAGDDPVELAGAWMHFGLARRVLQSVKSGELTLQRMADVLGVSYEDQRRKLNGDQALRDKDIALWTLVTRADLEPIGDFDGLLPPGTAALTGRWEPGDWLPELITPGVDVASVDMTTFVATVSTRITKAQTAGIVDCIDSGALRYFIVESLSAVGVAADQIHVEADSADCSVGTPERLVVRALSLPLTSASNSTSRLDIVRLAGTTILELAEHVAPRRCILVFGTHRSVAAAEVLLPREALRAGITTALGPFDILDKAWRNRTVEITPLASQKLGENLLHLVEVGKLRRVG